MSDQEKSSDQLDELLECYLYGATIHDRDDARRALAARGSSALVKRLLGLLLGPRRDARRQRASDRRELPDRMHKGVRRRRRPLSRHTSASSPVCLRGRGEMPAVLRGRRMHNLAPPTPRQRCTSGTAHSVPVRVGTTLSTLMSQIRSFSS